jgi:hypothetical protein
MAQRKSLSLRCPGENRGLEGRKVAIQLGHCQKPSPFRYNPPVEIL